MKFALVNPAWTFEGSTYFGCQEPHYPLELLFAFDQIKESEATSLLAIEVTLKAAAQDAINAAISVAEAAINKAVGIALL